MCDRNMIFSFYHSLQDTIEYSTETRVNGTWYPIFKKNTWRLEGDLIRLYAADVRNEVIGYFLKYIIVKASSEHRLDSK